MSELSRLMRAQASFYGKSVPCIGHPTKKPTPGRLRHFADALPYARYRKRYGNIIDMLCRRAGLLAPQPYPKRKPKTAQWMRGTR